MIPADIQRKDCLEASLFGNEKPSYREIQKLSQEHTASRHSIVSAYMDEVSFVHRGCDPTIQWRPKTSHDYKFCIDFVLFVFIEHLHT